MRAQKRIVAIAHQVSRLTPDWRDPERYFQNRSEIERQLKRLARDMAEAAHG